MYKVEDTLFRGMQVNTNKWVKGNLSHYPDGRSFIVNPIGINAVAVEVQNETVGQYSGWNDKHGNKIFTGDIIRLINEDLQQIDVICEFGKVIRQIFEYEVEISGFYFRLPDGRKCFPIVNNYLGKHDTELYEVVGTVYDNRR